MSWQFIITPLVALLLSQLIKLATNDVKGDFNLKGVLISYGGMPSGHSAFAASITMLVGLQEGFLSPIFAVALVFSLLIIRDALGLRQEMSRQAKAIGQLWDKAIFQDGEKEKKPVLHTKMGHTFSEVSVGCLIGIFVACLFYFVL